MSAQRERGWIDEPEWRRIQRLVPVPCVDIIPLNPARDRDGWTHVGLILRDVEEITGDDKQWCFVGGRIRIDESVHEAALRHIRETFGKGVRLRWEPALRPVIGEYHRTPKRGFSFDPRNHCVTLTYALAMVGTPVPDGEAVDFRWFLPSELPTRLAFRQELVLRKWLRLLGALEKGPRDHTH